MTTARRPLLAARTVSPGAVRAVAVPYVLSRVLVIATLLLSRHVVSELHVVSARVQTHGGLLGWDAAWYRDIARGGYDAVDVTGLRFFPLVPLLARAIAWLPGIDAGVGLLIVSNASALAAGALCYRLVWRERGDSDLARRAVWICYLAPPAFVLVMGYAEATLMTCALVALLALRARTWWLAAIAGFLAGVTRPIGVLLAVPALVEALVDGRRSLRRDLAGHLAAVVAPIGGAAVYLAWAANRTHDALYPLRVQDDPTRRGSWIDPVRGFAHAVRELASGDHVSAGLHVGTALVLVALMVVLARRWPLSYTAYAIATLLVGLSSRNLDSLERYSLSTVPFLFAAADVVATEERERVVLTLLSAGLVAAATLAFMGVLVP